MQLSLAINPFSSSLFLWGANRASSKVHIFQEGHKKFEKLFQFLLTFVVNNFKGNWRIVSNFVAFSEITSELVRGLLINYKDSFWDNIFDDCFVEIILMMSWIIF